ncbi:MAG: CopG family transcriptional regulator [Candidatus Aureabacteria bacterium]|nr:CopG family transcriptional regulator [Candidatus Auribacterota bacterium]
MSDPDAKVTIKIPRPLYLNLKRLVADSRSGFDSVTDFIVYVLRDIASTRNSPSRPDRVWDKKELEEVKKKLRQLGYLI